MAYQEVVEVYRSTALKMRVMACVASETGEDPFQWVTAREWALAAQPGWAEAWAEAKQADPENSDLGSSGSVVSDEMILAAVQALSAP